MKFPRYQKNSTYTVAKISKLSAGADKEAVLTYSLLSSARVQKEKGRSHTWRQGGGPKETKLRKAAPKRMLAPYLTTLREKKNAISSVDGRKRGELTYWHELTDMGVRDLLSR